tara:strand:+ start:4960 stop:6240 length:1281 start_codon:yes stop_codon:yes gene_type:complete
MPIIKDIKAREIIDSRGNPTVECDIILDNSIFGRASVPSGASVGSHECKEIRDHEDRFFGKGVLKAVNNINNQIKKNILNFDIYNQRDIDNKLISLDGTKDKSNLGANSILAVSIACAKAAALSKNIFLYEYLNIKNSNILPVPMFNILNGGSHADNNIDFQEFMIAPIGANSFKNSIQIGCEIFHSLKKNLSKKSLNTNVGDEGGFAPNLRSPNEALDLILESIIQCNYKPGKDIVIALDIASNEFFDGKNYNLKGENKILSSEEFCNYLDNISNNYPIYSIEDGLSEDDWSGWKILTNLIGNKIQLVGDDLFVTNLERLSKGVNEKIANSILIKLNQIGTITEVNDVISYATNNKYSCIISHRSGETEDTTIADLSVASNAGQIKTGSLSRTDRLSKYNQLIRIEENLGKNAKFYGNKILNSKH